MTAAKRKEKSREEKSEGVRDNSKEKPGTKTVGGRETSIRDVKQSMALVVCSIPLCDYNEA